MNRGVSWRSKVEPNREGLWRNRMANDQVSSTTEKFSQLKTSLSEEDVHHSVLKANINRPMSKDEDDIILKASVEELRRPTLTEQQSRTNKTNKKSSPPPPASDEKSWMKVVKLSREEQEELER